MKELFKEFIGTGEVKGFKFFQKRATEKAYLYEVSDEGKIHYEVFQKRVNERYGNICKPTSKSFGIWAWTYRNYQEAINKFNELNRGE